MTMPYKSENEEPDAAGFSQIFHDDLSSSSAEFGSLNGSPLPMSPRNSGSFTSNSLDMSPVQRGMSNMSMSNGSPPASRKRQNRILEFSQPTEPTTKPPLTNITQSRKLSRRLSTNGMYSLPRRPSYMERSRTLNSVEELSSLSENVTVNVNVDGPLRSRIFSVSCPSLDTILLQANKMRRTSVPDLALVDYNNIAPETQRRTILPTISNSRDDKGRNRINHETMEKILRGEFCQEYDEVFIIDGRFSYEYEGGHIINAKNIQCPEELERNFFQEPPPPDKKFLIIFHCEYSQKRGPELYDRMRKRDRELNVYPNLYYPEIYLLDKGYQGFYEYNKTKNQVATFCDPANYISMHDPKYNTECREMLGDWRRKRMFRRTLSL